MHTARGFTFVELLVVLVLLGVLTSLTMLSSGIANSPARKLNDEAERLNSLLRVLLDEAVLDNREYGVHFDQHSYQVLRFDPRKSRWVPQDGKTHKLPEWVEISIEVEERNITLLSSKDEKKALLIKPPQLLILSSGELTPFTLRLASDRGQDTPVLLLSSDGFAAPQLTAEKIQ